MGNCIHSTNDKNKGFLNSNHTGITFGSGIGTDIKAIANQGCKLMVTDLNESDAKELGWLIQINTQKI